MSWFDPKLNSFGNAAGFLKTETQTNLLLESAAMRITVGSITLQPRTGNIGDTYYFDSETGTSYNALGMPNPGIEATLAWLPRMQERCASADKQLWVSVAGFSPSEYGELTRRAAPYVDGVELNLGCGNIWGKTGQKPIPAQDPELFQAVLDAVKLAMPDNTKIAVKLSRVDPSLLCLLAIMVNNADFVSEVVQGNTRTNQRALCPSGREALAFREAEEADVKHTGGMGGRALLREGLDAVDLLDEILHKDVGIVACGGVEGGSSCTKYHKLGAVGFQIGTAFGEHGPRIFSDILEELMRPD